MMRLVPPGAADALYEEALINLIAIWASERNPLRSPDPELPLMDRLGWLIVRAGAIYNDIHIMESGHALRAEAAARGYQTELL